MVILMYSSCNVFIVKNKIISTPETKGTILPGIMRESIIDVARGQGFQVEERPVPVEELLDADEDYGCFLHGYSCRCISGGQYYISRKKITR